MRLLSRSAYCAVAIVIIFVTVIVIFAWGGTHNTVFSGDMCSLSINKGGKNEITIMLLVLVSCASWFAYRSQCTGTRVCVFQV